jgi:NitT/TauT family transport system substrate-binding protein
MPMTQTRRRFLTTLSMACAASTLPSERGLAAESALETDAIRLPRQPVICFAPQYVCEELLRAEGFADIRYVDVGLQAPDALRRGRVDFASNLSLQQVIMLDAGDPITIIAGVHAGCYELFAQDGIRNIGELKGKSIAAPGAGAGAPALISMIAAYVGLDPKKDLTIITDPAAEPLKRFIDGRLDAFLAFPPQPQELHALKIGHVILRTAVDRPWSQYFCCTLAGHQEYVARYPVATKRVLRAFLKAADLCVSEPERAARLLVDGGFAERYDYALQTLNENLYGAWREYDAEDTIRFYALRLHELGVIKTSPKRIIDAGTDWRFLNELKRELKA